MRKVLALAVMLGGCVLDERPPETLPEDFTIPNEIATPPGGDDAIAVVKAFYEAELGEELPEITVRWTSERIPLDAAGTTTVIGVHYRCSDIRITWWEAVGTDFRKIAVAHEIAHCARNTVEGSGDGAHTDPLWWDRDTGLVRLANIELGLAGF